MEQVWYILSWGAVVWSASHRVPRSTEDKERTESPTKTIWVVQHRYDCYKWLF